MTSSKTQLNFQIFQIRIVENFWKKIIQIAKSRILQKNMDFSGISMYMHSYCARL